MMDAVSQWQTLSNKELTRQFSPSQWVDRLTPDTVIQNHIDILNAWKAEVCRAVSCDEINYSDDSDRTSLDWYGLKQVPTDAPAVVYIHGGYWQALTKDSGGAMAKWLIENGCSLVSVEYDLAPTVSMETIIHQIKKAVEFILKRCTENKCRGVFISGHSAGGHLTAMVGTEDWRVRVPGMDHRLIKGLIPISGVFDLRPLVMTSVNDLINMTPATAWSCSPLSHIDKMVDNNQHVPHLVAVAQRDTAQFRFQTQHYTKTLQSRGISADIVDVDGCDHFDIIENLTNSDDYLAKNIMNFISKQLLQRA